jgi:hypothetical protein
MSDETLDDALDELYGADPGEFVAARKRLSASLRAAGNKDGAKELLGARRPSTSAWALNQVARLEPDVVENVLDASSALFAAQTRGSSKPDALREAIRTHRDAIDVATEAALGVLGNRANDKFRSEIVSTLRAVSTDDEAGDQLRTGRIVREASASGFPDSGGLTLVPDLPAPTKKPAAKAGAPKKPAEGREQPDKREIAAREKREREEQQRADRAAKAAARKDADAAEAEADRAQARVDELEDELVSARQELQVARTRSRKAKSTLRDLR